jgi:pentatricopeptide repeat protein
MTNPSPGRKRTVDSGPLRVNHHATTRWILVAILAFAAISRLLYLHAYRSDPFDAYLIHDARRYHDAATTLAAGGVWETGVFYQAPLYPYLVAAVYTPFGPALGAVYALQLLCGLLTIFLVFRIARSAYGRPAGLAAAGIASLYGAFVFYETKLLPASLAVLLATLLIERMQAADAAPRDAGWLGPGIVLGAAALTSPAILLMAPAAAVWIARDRSRPAGHKVRRLAALFVGAALLVAPVSLRNRAVSGESVPISANGGITFYQGNNPNALGVFSAPPGFSGRIFAQREESRKLAEAETGRRMRDGEVSSFWFRKGIAFLAGNPLRSARLLSSKLLLALANDNQPLEYNERLDENRFRWLWPLPFAVILALAAIRIHARRESRPSGRAEHPILMLLLVEAVTLLAFYVSGRYRLPAVPALAVVAGCGAAWLAGRLAGGVRRAMAPAATAALVAALSFAYVPLVHGTLRDQQAAMGLIDRGRALWETGRRDEAIEVLQRAVRLDPDFPGLHLDRGKSLREVGRYDEAERSIREALRLDPGYADAHFHLGLLFVRQERPDAALNAFAEAYRLDPTSGNAANNLLGMSIHLGRMEQARRVWRDMRERGLPIDPSLDQEMLVRLPGDP